MKKIIKDSFTWTLFTQTQRLIEKVFYDMIWVHHKGTSAAMFVHFRNQRLKKKLPKNLTINGKIKFNILIIIMTKKIKQRE